MIVIRARAAGVAKRALTTFIVMLALDTAAAAAPPPPLLDVRAIDRYVLAEQRRQHIPGIELAVYRQGHAILEKGYGMANVELNVPVRAQTLMQSGSVGKQFTATALMMLVEQGKVSLKDSITRFFPDAPDSWKPILVENLLSHTSGLAEYESDARSAPGGDFDLRLDFSEDELLQKIERMPIEFASGNKWEYRNTNYALLGILIHRATGLPYGEFLKQRIFSPLGMHDTRIISERAIVMNRAAGYELDGGVLQNQTYVSPTFNSTADGTMYFDVVDLEQWDRALYGTALLTAESLKLMWTPFVLNDGKPNKAGYGFGWEAGDVNGHRVIEHGGAWQGFTCHIARYVDDSVTVVVLTNLDAQHADPQSIARVVAGIVDPNLVPKVVDSIADAQPSLAANFRRLLQAVQHGEDASGLLAAQSEFHVTAEIAADLAASLPQLWEKAPMTLLDRAVDAGNTVSTYRVGVIGDTRWVRVHTDAAGKILRFRVEPDRNLR